jgi:N-acetylmuramoyl-L-alanine amidase
MHGIGTGLRLCLALTALAGALCLSGEAGAAVVVRQRIGDGVFAAIRDGQFIFLECRPEGALAQQRLSPYLANPAEWSRYKGLQSAVIPRQQLNGGAQRLLIETLFPYDYADQRGWWHTVGFSGEQGQETWQAVTLWLTGSSKATAKVLHLPENQATGPSLERGERVFVPKELLLATLQVPSTKRIAPPEPPKPMAKGAPQQQSKSAPLAESKAAPLAETKTPPSQTKPGTRSEGVKRTQPAAEPVMKTTPRERNSRGRGVNTVRAEPRVPEEATPAPEPVATPQPTPLQQPVLASPPPHARGAEGEGEPPMLASGDLTYGKDDRGPYAAYRLKRGEAVYTAVVVRFTDFQTREDINAACDTVLARSGISDPTRIDAGQAIRIPMDILSDRYWPEESAERKGFESMKQEAARLRETRVQSNRLEGVVVVIDPGHGGRDQGASNPEAGLYEDELNYDMACRLKILLESTTRAKVYFTMTDPKQGYEPRNVTRFTSDKTEELLTTPRYWNEDAKVSANLRWYLSNDIYRRECKKGVDPRKVVFISIHCDALHEKMRGTMVYVPGAKYRRDTEQPSGVVYADYEETNGHAAVKTTGPDRSRDEALSRNFAERLIETLRAHTPQIAVNKHGDPIRNVIRQGKGTAYVPAVLRNNLIPTKVLVETANLNNATDRERLADPEWRQDYAQALTNALLAHF